MTLTTMAAAIAVLVVLIVSFFAVRLDTIEGPLLHVTTADGLESITADPPEGWVHLRPGHGWMRRLPLLGWPPRPSANRICFYLGAEWPSRFREPCNLPYPERCTHAVLVDVDALQSHGGGGRLYRRRFDRSAAWSGEYRGPGRIIVKEPPVTSSPWGG